MRKILIVLFALFFISVKPVLGIYDPRSMANNKFGIHIIDENDINAAALLLNSSGGDWGYITMVIPENERKLAKWSEIFRNLKRKHLIPIIRIASKLEKDYWQKPDTSEIENWVDFLDNLPWPIKNRYVVIYNEPNHAKEWGNSIEPESYSDFLLAFSLRLKEKSEDFFLLPAGLDASAPNSNSTMDETDFLRRMLNENPDIFDHIDGWTSHSYPNPNFSGSPDARGRGSIANFVWELGLIKSLGINKDLPVFITETGWAHNQEESLSNSFLSPDSVSENFLKAYKNVWNNKDIVAVTPFLLNYQSFPFANFSWRKLNSEEYYPQYETYRKIAKVKGTPIKNIILPSISPVLGNKDILGISEIKDSSPKLNILASFWTILLKLIV